MNPIQCHAPGKVMLWGEYAVLSGAPALVMAVNRYAHCTVQNDPARRPHRHPDRDPAGKWCFTTQGFATPPEAVSVKTLQSNTPPDSRGACLPSWHVLQVLNASEDPGRSLEADSLQEGGSVHSDTREFYQGVNKLGLGSSAAIATATYGAFCELLGRGPRLDEAMAVHHRLQGTPGSGFDVAAAFHGGVLRFQNGSAEPWKLPPGLARAFIWTGKPASTSRHITKFQQWRSGGTRPELQALCAAAERPFSASRPLSALEDYVTALQDVDRAAQLDIFSLQHRELSKLALRHQVVYKPCGAGGGDLGVAFSDDPERLAAFVDAARPDFDELILETAPYGIQTAS